MKRFVVVGAVRATGMDIAREVKCHTEEYARELASEQGVIVSRVLEVEADESVRSRPAESNGVPKWIGVVALLVAALISVPHILQLLYLREVASPLFDATTRWVATDRDMSVLSPEIAVHAIGENRAIIVVHYPNTHPTLTGKPTKFYMVGLDVLDPGEVASELIGIEIP